MPDSTLIPGTGGRKAVVLSAAILLPMLICAFLGGIAYLGWGKHGSDTKKLSADDSPAAGDRASGGQPGRDLTGGDVAEVEIAGGVTMKFCWIPPGRAILGSPVTEKGHDSDEREHDYESRGFWLAKYAVTQEEWRSLMKDNPNPSYFTPDQGDIAKAGITDTSRFPVEYVSWNECRAFLKEMNARAKVPAAMGRGKFVLPHEDEWEYACRGGLGNGRAFYFGDRLNGDLANCNGNYPYGTETKGEYKKRMTRVGDYEKVAPHPWGLCDMSGNVWQWCGNLDKKDEDVRFLRGGSWNGSATNCRSASRSRVAPDGHLHIFGFRLCFRPD